MYHICKQLDLAREAITGIWNLVEGVEEQGSEIDEKIAKEHDEVITEIYMILEPLIK